MIWSKARGNPESETSSLLSPRMSPAFRGPFAPFRPLAFGLVRFQSSGRAPTVLTTDQEPGGSSPPGRMKREDLAHSDIPVGVKVGVHSMPSAGITASVPHQRPPAQLPFCYRSPCR